MLKTLLSRNTVMHLPSNNPFNLFLNPRYLEILTKGIPGNRCTGTTLQFAVDFLWECHLRSKCWRYLALKIKSLGELNWYGFWCSEKKQITWILQNYWFCQFPKETCCAVFKSLKAWFPSYSCQTKYFQVMLKHNLCCRLWNKLLGLFFILGVDDTKISLRVSVLVWSHKASPVIIM